MSFELSNIIKFIQDEKTTGTIIFGRKRQKVESEKKKEVSKKAPKFPRLTYSEVSPETTEYFKHGYTRFLEKRKSWRPNNDKFSDTDTGEYQVLAVSEIQDQELLGDPALNDEITTIEPSFTRGLRFIEYRFKKGREFLRVFTHYTPGMFFQRKSKRKLAIVFGGSQLTPINKDLLVLPSNFIDCLLYKETMYIFQESNFDQIFEMKEKYSPNAKAVFKYFKSDDSRTELGYSILGVDELESKCIHLGELKKMNSIFSGMKHKKLNFDDILVLNKDYGIGAKIDEPNHTIDFQGNVEAFVRLYDLRHLAHPRTGDKVIGLRVKHV